MKLKNGQELYDAGTANRQTFDLTISPEQARAVREASKRADRGACAPNTDSINQALLKAEHSGRVASFLEFYEGPLSDSVLAAVIEAGTLPLAAEVV